MMRNLKYTLLAATILLSVPQLTHAQAIDGAYVGAGGGMNFLQNEHIKDRLVDEATSRKYASLYTVSGKNYATQSKVSGDMNHSILIGVRYALKTPQPAPVADVPVMQKVNKVNPPPSRSYLLFFN